MAAHYMRALVLRGKSSAWEAGPRSAAELKEAATHFERYVELQPAPARKAQRTRLAAECRGEAEAMEAAEAAAKAEDAGSRSAEELKRAAKHWERAAELHPNPALKTDGLERAAACRVAAEAMEAAEPAAKAEEMAVAEAKANAAADALLAEEEAEKAAAAGKAQGMQGTMCHKGKGKKGKGKGGQ